MLHLDRHARGIAAHSGVAMLEDVAVTLNLRVHTRPAVVGGDPYKGPIVGGGRTYKCWR